VAARLQEHHSQGQPVVGWRDQALAQHWHGKPDKLKIGGGQSWVAADEGDRLVHAGGEQSATQEEESGELGWRVCREQGDRPRAVHGDRAGRMVLQVRTNTYQVVTRLHAHGAQLLGLADA
jgi:hypothetical protein